MIRVHDAVPYVVPRGSCPACGSGEVIHLVIGMPANPEAWGSGPDWVRWVGCVHPGWDRECAQCGHRSTIRSEMPMSPDLEVADGPE